MSLELSYNAEQIALQGSIDGFCRRMGTGPGFTDTEPLPAPFWSGLAELGVLGLGTDAGGGGAVEIAAAMETLGGHGAPGPLVGTFAASTLLSARDLDAVAASEAIVSVGHDGLYPWAQIATIHIDLDSDAAWRVRPGAPPVAVDTTAGEPWARLDVERVERLGDPTIAGARSEVAIAAYLVGAAQALVASAADYARDRIQFKKPIATFQAVSHPLATSAVQVSASRILVRGAAQRLDRGDRRAPATASSARLSAVSTATDAAYRAHQLFGALGFTLEGPVAHLTRRIRQVGLLPPPQAGARERVLTDLGIPPTKGTPP